MLDQRRAAAHPEDDREQLFTERYEALLAWALRLTHQQRDSAEDLVQDAFVQFMLGRTRLEEIENIDGYLRRMLRYMHVSRMSRAAQHLPDTMLSVADYDSFRLGWTAIEPSRRMQAFEELHQICAYACSRKESSRAGSVFILRFFHNYYPTEIASILSSSRHCVDQWQRLARREAKVFMNEPGRLRFVDAKAPTAPAWIDYPSSDCDLMLALRRMIFNSCHGACLSEEELQRAYAGDSSDTLPTIRLAHVVSCLRCLNSVNTLLGLPLLAQRYQSENNDGEDPPRDAKGGGSGGVSSGLPNKFKKQLREVREHKPKELRISVNGLHISSFKIGSEVCEFDLNLPPDESIEFVEVFSEQGIQLLFVGVSETDCEAEQWAKIELSEGRNLEVCVRVQDQPNLHVVYTDAVTDELSASEPLKRNNLSSPLTIVPKFSGRDDPQRRSGFWAAVTHRLNILKTALRQRVSSEARTGSHPVTESIGLCESTAAFANRNRHWPAFAAFLVAIVAIVAGMILYRSALEPPLTVTTLLERARNVEISSRQIPGQITHRLTNLEIRLSSEGAVVSRQTIDAWENHDNRQRIQRLYNDDGRLIAAASQRGDGARTLYHHGSKGRTPGPSTPDSVLLDLDDVWQLTPSLQDVNNLIGDPAAANLLERSTSYVVHTQKERSIGASRLLKASLTLAKSDLRPIEQTLVVQRGEELREYRFVETKFELFPSQSVAPTVFDVEPELIEAVGVNEISGTRAHRDPTSNLSSSMTAAASAELEIDVTYLLNQAKADRNEQVTLTRSASGSLRVEGVLDTDQRRAEFLRILRPVADNPAVDIHIWTIAEASKRQFKGSTEAVQEVEATANTIAVDEELREYCSRLGLNNEAIDESVRSYSSRVVNRAYRALFHAVELKRLIARFARVDMRTVAPDARSKWLEMMREHALGYEQETAALRRDLQPIFFSETSTEVEDFAIGDDADLTRAVERLHKLALSTNEAIRAAFTISSQSSAVALKSAQFKRSLLSAMELSERIARYSQ